jgi:DNA-binding NarL/FixJ family response regulator
VAIRLAIVTSVRMLGEGLVQVLRPYAAVSVVGLVQHLGALRELLQGCAAEVVLLDVCGGLDLDEVRLFAAEQPEVKLLALGLVEQRAEVIRYARVGFSGYIARDTPLLELVPVLREAVRGGARCSAEIAGGLMQALFRPDQAPAPDAAGPLLTRREGEVLRLLGRGFSNKEIARELELSAATVKNYVHNLLSKLQMARRNEAARRVRERPWIAGPGP